jgi:ABC-type nickel/cobalt efflux system permease component RcnA
MIILTKTQNKIKQEFCKMQASSDWGELIMLLGVVLCLIVIFILFLLLWLGWPLIGIWAINVLFGTGIPINVVSLIACWVILILLNTKFTIRDKNAKN